MKLLIDLGNTRLKWQLWSAQGQCENGILSHADINPGVMQRVWQDRTIDSVWMGAVADRTLISDIETCFAAESIPVNVLSSPHERCGVINSYTQPERLGVDRWLGLVAARHYCQGAVLVADAGTALTLDVLDPEGQHLGGMITPGLNLMRKSLNQHTALLPEVEGGRVELGQSTEAAIANGTHSMLCALLEQVFKREQIKFPDLQCVVTGGDGLLVYNALSIPARYEPDWLFKGLWLESGGEIPV